MSEYAIDIQHITKTYNMYKKVLSAKMALGNQPC